MFLVALAYASETTCKRMSANGKGPVQSRYKRFSVFGKLESEHFRNDLCALGLLGLQRHSVKSSVYIPYFFYAFAPLGAARPLQGHG